MPDIIKLLTDVLANQIAAGEVIQRPASAVKELLENAIDAGATRITLVLKDAGKQLIQVIDNGKGMTPTDARMCFERHATSKIKQIDDLFSINTFGFRGEAMASIAAVAQVELKTAIENSDSGTTVVIEGNELKSQTPCSSQKGTSIAVKNLFYNVPARRNFLKSNQVELRHILDEFHRVALAYSAISFQVLHNGSTLFDLKPTSLRQRIVQLLGDTYNQHIAPVQEDASIMSIHGFIGKPQVARKTRGDQYFFVNKRFIKDPYLNHAVMQAYEDLLQNKTYPLYVLFIEIDPRQIDINVHPTKTEIKFQDERSVYAVLHAAVKRSLSQYQLSPSIDFTTESAFNNILPGELRAEMPIMPQTTLNPNYNPFEKPISGNQNFTRRREADTNTENWQSLFEIISQRDERSAAGLPELEQNAKLQDLGQLPVFQIHQKYLLSTIKSGVMLINKAAAHERVLYEKLIKQLHGQKNNSQQSLFPEQLQLNASDAMLLEELIPQLKLLGFDLEIFGNNTYILQGCPADIPISKQVQTILGLLEQFKTNKTQLRIEMHDNIARSLAKQMAISPEKMLTQAEMQQLIDELFACETPYYTPNGKQTLVTWTHEQLEQLFK